MRTIILLLSISTSLSMSLHAQTTQLDVLGHSKIRGNLDLGHMDDEFSIHIGKDAGINTVFTFFKYNTFFGHSSGKQNNLGANNAFFGSNSGASNYDGSQNAFFGGSAGGANYNGQKNSFFGFSAGFNNTSGDDNSYFGQYAGQNNSSGDNNSFFGSYAGADLSGYSNNSFFGKDAGRMYLSGDDNSFFGVSSGYRNSGNSNAFFGSNTGDDHITGSYNTFIGANSGDSGYENHSIAIGYNAKVKCDNCAVIGGTAMADMVRVGIGVDSPTVLLHLLAPNAVAPVGITQNLVGSGGSSTMELTTQDGSQKQASRLVFRGNNDFPDIEFYRGGRGSEQITMFIEGGNGNVGINNQVPSEKLDVNGKARIRTIGSAASIGALHYTASGVLTTSTSDRRLKENIHTLESPLEKTLALRGVNYSWKNDSTHTKRLGLIAQEVEEIVPEVVFTNEVDGYKGIHYQELPALLIEAIKEQQILIEGLQKELTELKQSLKKHPRLYSEK